MCGKSREPPFKQQLCLLIQTLLTHRHFPLISMAFLAPYNVPSRRLKLHHKMLCLYSSKASTHSHHWFHFRPCSCQNPQNPRRLEGAPADRKTCIIHHVFVRKFCKWEERSLEMPSLLDRGVYTEGFRYLSERIRGQDHLKLS